MENVIQNIKEAQEDAPTIYHATPLVVLKPDAPAFSPSVLTREAKWPALPVRADTAHAAPALTKTADPDSAIPAAIRSGKKIQIAHDQQTVKPRPPVRPSTQTVTPCQMPVL